MPTSDSNRRGQAIRGSGTEWSERRVLLDLSISELAKRSGVARSLVGLIDKGRMIPTPAQAAALLRVFEERAGEEIR